MRQWMCLWLFLTFSFPITAGEALAEPTFRTQDVQKILLDRGYDPGPVDGILGERTRRALRGFQRAQNLPVTGRPDRRTRAALDQLIPATAVTENQRPPQRSPLSVPTLTESPRPVIAVTTLQYRPPRRGAPEMRIAAASRAKGETLSLAVLVPSDHTGMTVQTQPTLYWYVSTPTQHRIDLTIVDEQGVQPLLDVTLNSPKQAGIQQIRLSDYNVQLQPGVAYKWSIAISPDPEHRSRDIVASGGIQRIEPDGSLRDKLTRANQGEIPAIYADAGVWYDALGAISDLVIASPEEKALRSQQAALLAQGGLQDLLREIQ